MRDIKERYLNDKYDESPMFLSPNAERDYRESKKEFKKHEKEFIAYYNVLKEGLKRLNQIREIGNNKENI